MPYGYIILSVCVSVSLSLSVTVSLSHLLTLCLCLFHSVKLFMNLSEFLEYRFALRVYHSLCVCVSVSVSVSLSVCLSLSLFLTYLRCVCISVSVSLSVCLSLFLTYLRCVGISVSVSLSVGLSLSLFLTYLRCVFFTPCRHDGGRLGPEQPAGGGVRGVLRVHRARPAVRARLSQPSAGHSTQEPDPQRLADSPGGKSRGIYFII